MTRIIFDDDIFSKISDISERKIAFLKKNCPFVPVLTSFGSEELKEDVIGLRSLYRIIGSFVML